MWTISDKQLDMVSKSIRSEFEKRAYFLCKKGKWDEGMDSDDETRQTIQKQSGYLARHGIKGEKTAMDFIKLAFLNPVMRMEGFDGTLSEIFINKETEEDKNESLINYLKSNNYVSEL